MKRPTLKQKLQSLAFLVIVDLLLGSAFWLCNYGYSIAHGPALITLRPPFIIWCAEALFLAVLLGVAFYDPSAIRRTTPQERRICLWLMCGIAIIPLMNVRKHVRFTATSLIEQRMFAWDEDSHPYARVSEIMLAYYWISTRNYKGPSSERGVFVTFSDGLRWSPQAELSAGEVLSREVARLISARIGLPVKYAPSDIVIGRPQGRH